MGLQTAALDTPEPPRLCEQCPRLVDFRKDNQAKEPSWFNGAVPSFGAETARLLIVGLAPGLNGANRTGRPFTGDFAGELLYATLLKYGFATGHYGARPDDGLELKSCMITNAVRCVPPQNKPTPAEIAACGGFLKARIAELPRLEIILALGRIAHDGTLSALGYRRSHFPFAHGARHALPTGLILFDSYHCSRYNTNTRKLTEEMFCAVFSDIEQTLSTRHPTSRPRS